LEDLEDYEILVITFSTQFSDPIFFFFWFGVKFQFWPLNLLRQMILGLDFWVS